MHIPQTGFHHIVEGEAIEAAALSSLHAQATPALQNELGLAWHDRAGARLSIAARLPASAIVINRAFGVRPDTLGAVATEYRAMGTQRFFLHLASAMDDMQAAAAQAGMIPARAWQKFERLPGTALPTKTAVVIRQVTPDTAEAAIAARIVCAAFDLGSQAEPWLARLGHDPRWAIFLAEIDGKLAGTGALFVDGGLGWIDWDATDPAFRCRGVQGALMAHRLQLADARGLTRVHTCTGLPAAGDPQHSFHNILRCGFVATTARFNWQPCATPQLTAAMAMSAEHRGVA